MTDQRLFNAIDLTNECPPAVCPACAAGSAIVHKPSGTVFSYCQHNRAGTLRTPGRDWVSICGIDRNAFKRAVMHALFERKHHYPDRRGSVTTLN